MRTKVANQLRASSSDFINVVWPAIQDQLGGGFLEPVESVTETAFTKTLDILSGIDAWQVINDVGVRGIASRVQWGNDWRTFTVRKELWSGAETEWHKIQRAQSLMDRGFIRAHLIVQAYLNGPPGSNSDLISAYIVRAPDMYRFCNEESEGLVWYPQAVTGGNTMAVFHVDRLKQAGCDVREVRPQEKRVA